MSKYVHCLQVFSHADTTHSPNDKIIIFGQQTLVTKMLISACSFYLYPLAAPTAPLSPIHHYERDIWSATPADGYTPPYGITLLSSLTAPCHFTDKPWGSLIWPVFLWDPSWGKSDNEQMRVVINL